MGTAEHCCTVPISYPGPLYILKEVQVAPPAPAPYLGQHNPEVYCGMLGRTKEQLVKLYQWINRLLCLGIGQAFLERSEVDYDVYAVR